MGPVIILISEGLTRKDTDRILSSPQGPFAETPETYREQQTMKNTILVMDDDNRILSALAFRLEDAGYVVWTASNGTNGLETALTKHPDLIVMDVCMPFGNGFSTLERLRSLKQKPVPVIFMTAYPLRTIISPTRGGRAYPSFS